MLRLVHDHAYSHSLLRYVLCREIQPHLAVPDKIRILLHGLRRGRFSMQWQWASAAGVERAKRDIAGQHMQPLKNGEFAF